MPIQNIILIDITILIILAIFIYMSTKHLIYMSNRNETQLLNEFKNVYKDFKGNPYKLMKVKLKKAKYLEIGVIIFCSLVVLVILIDIFMVVKYYLEVANVIHKSSY